MRVFLATILHDISHKVDIILDGSTRHRRGLIQVDYVMNNFTDSVGNTFADNFIVRTEKGYWSPIFNIIRVIFVFT